MRFSVDKKALKEALTVTKSCLPLKPMTEFEANPVLHVAPGSVTVVATDMGQVCSVRVEAEALETFQVSMDLKKLEKVLAKSDNGQVTIDYDQKIAKISSTGEEGFVEIPTLSVDKCPVFDRIGLAEDGVSGDLDAVVLTEAIDFVSVFLPEVLERNPKYDFLLIKDSIVYAADGVSRRGYFVSAALRFPGELKILKKFARPLPKLLKFVGDQKVTVKNLDRVISIASADGKFQYACIKARSDAPDVPLSYLKSSGPYTDIDLAKCVKSMEKIVIPEYQSAGASVGVSLHLSPADASGQAHLGMGLISAGKYNGKEKMSCKRVDEVDGGVIVDKVVDFKMFKEIVSCFSKKGEVKLYMNDPESRYFKLQQKYVVGAHPCVAVAAGTYARLSRI